MIAWAALGKAAMGGLKAGAKKVATDKLLNRKKKTNKRRASAKKIMGLDDKEKEGGALAIRPTMGLVHTERDFAPLSTSVGESDIIIIKKQVIQVRDILKDTYSAKEQERKNLRKAKQLDKKKKEEDKIEKPKVKPKDSKGMKMPNLGLGIGNFLTWLVIGLIFAKLNELMPAIRNIVKTLKPIADFIGGIFEKTIGFIVGFIDVTYGAIEELEKAIEAIGGEGAKELFEKFGKLFTQFINGALIAALVANRVGLFNPFRRKPKIKQPTRSFRNRIRRRRNLNKRLFDSRRTEKLRRVKNIRELRADKLKRVKKFGRLRKFVKTKQFLGKGIDLGKNIGKRATPVVKSVVKTATPVLKAGAKTGLKAVSGTLKAAKKIISPKVGQKGSQLTKKIKSVETIQNLTPSKGINLNIGKRLRQAGSTIVKLGKGVMNSLPNFNKLGKKLGGALTTAYQNSQEWVKKRYDNVVDISKSLKSKYDNALKGAGNAFNSMKKGAQEAVMKKVLEPVMKFLEPIKKQAASIGGQIYKTLSGIPGFDNITKVLNKFGGKGSKGLLKKLGAKALPIIGGVVNMAFAYDRLSKGDSVGGLIEGISGILDFTGMAPVSLLLDGYMFARDFVPQIQEGEETAIDALGLSGFKSSIDNIFSKLPSFGEIANMITGGDKKAETAVTEDEKTTIKPAKEIDKTFKSGGNTNETPADIISNTTVSSEGLDTHPSYGTGGFKQVETEIYIQPIEV